MICSEYKLPICFESYVTKKCSFVRNLTAVMMKRCAVRYSFVGLLAGFRLVYNELKRTDWTQFFNFARGKFLSHVLQHYSVASISNRVRKNLSFIIGLVFLSYFTLLTPEAQQFVIKRSMKFKQCPVTVTVIRSLNVCI
jgi:hypothetical protein